MPCQPRAVHGYTVPGERTVDFVTVPEGRRGGRRSSRRVPYSRPRGRTAHLVRPAERDPSRDRQGAGNETSTKSEAARARTSYALPSATRAATVREPETRRARKPKPAQSPCRILRNRGPATVSLPVKDVFARSAHRLFRAKLPDAPVSTPDLALGWDQPLAHEPARRVRLHGIHYALGRFLACADSMDVGRPDVQGEQRPIEVGAGLSNRESDASSLGAGEGHRIPYQPEPRRSPPR